MSKCIDETGNKYGKWTVIERDYAHEKTVATSCAYWKCVCECGTVKTFRSTKLRSKTHTDSCNRCKPKITPEIDETGNVYGHLSILEKDIDLSTRNNGAWWVCICSCGNTQSFSGIELRGGKRLHCTRKIHRRINLEEKAFKNGISVVGRGYEDVVLAKCPHCEKEFEVDRSYVRYLKSCGCRAGGLNRNDETGRRYGKLTVLKRIGSNQFRKPLWRCVCDCGNFRNVDSSTLKNSARACFECVGENRDVYGSGYIYIFKGIGGKLDRKYKIGLTTQPDTRMHNLAYSYDIDYAQEINKLFVHNMRKVEKHLHDKYASKRVLGEHEWFDLSDIDVAYISYLCDIGENNMCELENIKL